MLMSAQFIWRDLGHSSARRVLSVQSWRNLFYSDKGIREILCPLYRSELLLLEDFRFVLCWLGRL